MKALSHLDRSGRARMVDVGGKPATRRRALAEGRVRMRRATLDAVRRQALAKGDALAVARVAAIMAAKRTSELIPLCHPLPLSSIQVEFFFELKPAAIRIEACVTGKARTGFEMEALTAAATAALTIYDMAKSSDKGMRIEGLRLLEKSGGKSGIFRAARKSRK